MSAALEIAREKGSTEVGSLLERFIANSAQTRHEIRVKLGMLEELAAEVFALTVFLCDLNEADNSSQRFRSCFQVTCQDSYPFSLAVGTL